MRELIIGRKGCGKTVRIQRMVSRIKNHLIFDFFGEYSGFKYVIQFKADTIIEMQDLIIQTINDTPKETVLIIDCSDAYIFPRPNKLGKLDFYWFSKLMKDRKFVLVYQNFRRVPKTLGKLTGITIYKTTDDQYTKDAFMLKHHDIIKKGRRLKYFFNY